jgi:hypothetical protein
MAVRLYTKKISKILCEVADGAVIGDEDTTHILSEFHGVDTLHSSRSRLSLSESDIRSRTLDS